MLASLGMPEEVVNATTDHDQLRELPEVVRSLGDIVPGETLLAVYVAWSGVDTDPVAERVELARRQHAELLPDVDAAAVAMLSVFS